MSGPTRDGGPTSPTQYDSRLAGRPEDWERLFTVYALTVYHESQSEVRRYLQRTVLVSTRNTTLLSKELDPLMETISTDDKTYEYELVELSTTFGDKKPQMPFDSSIVTATTPLRAALRSPKTGAVFYDNEMQFCPHTGVPLRPFVTTRGA